MEKRKRDRKANPRGAAAAGNPTGSSGAAGTDGKKKTGANRPKTENEEQLLQIIDDLRNDLRIRDEEYSEQSRYLKKVE